MNGNGRRSVLIAGGGVAALEAALALQNLAEDRVAVELLAPERGRRLRRGRHHELHVKQGGIAAQQADVAAEAIAAVAGANVTPKRFQPVLRGLLLTGREPRYLRRELGVEADQKPVASYEPLW